MGVTAWNLSVDIYLQDIKMAVGRVGAGALWLFSAAQSVQVSESVGGGGWLEREAWRSINMMQDAAHNRADSLRERQREREREGGVG
jgi:hypothetical protein